jgi:hypothetical protein
MHRSLVNHTAKRFFRATPAGIAAAKHALHLMQSMAAGLDEVLE